jgi:LysR family glycine cleavage system transcriptional activator
MTRFDMPPFAALRAFEAAARLGSFRDAAAEIGVTASAVSHQVKALEEWIGALLFERAIRAVRLTEEGRTLARDVASGFGTLQAGLARAKSRARDTRLRISALPLIANVWLAPRLAQFQSRFPDVAIEIDTANRLADFENDSVDVAIRNVFAPTPGLSSRKLLDLKAIPLCTPAIARTLADPADLAKAASFTSARAKRAGRIG